MEPTNAGQKNTLMALLCYLGILVVIPLLTDAKSDPFVKFHIKQGLVLLITEVILMFIGMVPFIGWMLYPLLALACLVLAIIGIVNAVSGEEKALPIIGQYADKIHI